MIDLKLVGFGAIMAVVVLGVDYQQQTRKTDVSISELGVGGYVDTIKIRYFAMKE